MRSATRKQAMGDKLRVERRALNKKETLLVDRSLCLGCGLCVEICPKEALKISDPVTEDGRLTGKALLDIQDQRCVFCGACVALCPVGAVNLTVNGTESIPVQEMRLFPSIMKNIQITESRCRVECGLGCQEQCPTEAITIQTGTTPEGRETIEAVKVDERLCLYCGRCRAACPLDAIDVKKPFSGSLSIRPDQCPRGCRICVDICRSKAIELDEKGKPTVSFEFCIYCKACERACPAKAIGVSISAVNHSEQSSGLWLEVLEKLSSRKTLTQELAVKSDRKRRTMVGERLL